MNDPGWPAGAAAVFNVNGRIAWWEGPPFGGGQWHAECRGNAVDLMVILERFAKIKTDRKRIVVHDGPGASFWIGKGAANEAEKPSSAIDWIFMVWQADRMKFAENLPPDLRSVGRDPQQASPVCQLDVYAGGNVRWEDVKVPAGLEVEDRRLAAHGFQPSDGNVLEGKVTASGNGSPLVAQVTLERIEPQPQGGYLHTSERTVESDAEGKWTIKQAPLGWFRIVVQAPEYATRVIDHVQLEKAPRWHSANTQLSPAVQLSGTVRDEGGQPLAGVQVLLRNLTADGRSPYEQPDAREIVTDDQGRFETKQVPQGHADISVYKEGYCRPGLGLKVELPQQNVELTMQQSTTVRVTVDFSKTARPSGYIVRLVPADGAAVGRWSGSGNIDDQNQLVFADVPPGKYVLTGRPNPGSDDEETDPLELDLKGGTQPAVKLQAK